jgi:DNA-directed RNA polymerase subunit RPC12/RpoP
METSQKELMVHLDRLVDVIDAMQIKRDTWKFRADEMEAERNRWQSKYEEAECSLRMVRRRAAELAYRLGELHCPNCGSENLALLHGIFNSGVEAPDGGKEVHYECALDCQECGHKEELAS